MEVRSIGRAAPIQPPWAHVSITGETWTAEESADAVTARPGALVALRAARLGEIVSPHTDAPWRCADIRLLRIHRLIVKVGRRIDGSARLRITPEGRKVLTTINKFRSARP